jgi:TusA-related sulfurtransferase
MELSIMYPDRELAEDVTFRPDAVLELLRGPAPQGATCAVLTPAIKAKLREMAGGQVLKVWVDDVAAREDIASWCRLSGHELLAVREESPQALCAYVRKKQD